MEQAAGQQDSGGGAGGLQALLAPDSLGASLLLAFLASAGLYYVNIFPAITQALISGAGMSTLEAGQVTSANAMGAAFGAFAVTFLIPRIPAWKATSAGLLLALLCLDLLTTQQQSAAVLVPLRFCHGFLGGALVGLGFSVIARTARPSLAFSLLLVVQYGGGALGLWLLPPLVPEHGPFVPFYALMAFCLVTLCMLPLLSPYPLPANARGRVLPGRDEVRWLPLSLTLAALFLFQAANMSLFAFIFGLGEHYGLTIDRMSPIIAIANIVSIGGAVLAAWTGVRFRLSLPVSLALAVSAAGTCLFLLSDSPALYLLANCVTGVAWAFCIPYFLTLSARFDNAGQMAALGGFASKMGLACGPVAAGYLLADGDAYPSLVLLAAALIACCLPLALAPARFIDRA